MVVREWPNAPSSSGSMGFASTRQNQAFEKEDSPFDSREAEVAGGHLPPERWPPARAGEGSRSFPASPDQGLPPDAEEARGLLPAALRHRLLVRALINHDASLAKRASTTATVSSPGIHHSITWPRSAAA